MQQQENNIDQLSQSSSSSSTTTAAIATTTTSSSPLTVVSSSPPNKQKPVAHWLHNNVLDYIAMKEIKNELLKKGIELNGPKTQYEDDKNVMETISNGIQVHLKQIIDLSTTSTRRRHDISTLVVFDQLKKQLKENDGNVTQDIKKGLTFAWDEDFNTELQYQELVAKKQIERKIHEDEITTRRAMLNYDIERSKLSQYKRKQGDDIPWWLKERSWEENGQLKWNDISIVQSHDKIAHKYKLGYYKKGKTDDDIEKRFQNDSIHTFNNEDIVKPQQSNSRCPLHGSRVTFPLVITTNDVLKNIQQYKKEKKIVNSNKIEVETMLKFGLIPRPPRNG